MLTFPLMCKRERVSRGLVLVAAGGRVRGHYDEGHHGQGQGDHVASVSAGTRVGTSDHPPPDYILPPPPPQSSSVLRYLDIYPLV